ncbi:gluconokinase [Yersinia kristensenii]|uniref:Gluconokinase n=1 Tax=Yersinia kristensenii TaxID=28152 RepID=A0A0T9LNZ3_YERKR|nr:gluconokinase [Yersinia kristensenii]OVZ81380.1 gluconate kinase [Yersinia kristensenii]PJG63654.1 gluconate kinase [Yersinia kristensenii]QKJ15789.1 gluconokinase [Yersinia kristensenii]CFR03271.1 putative thermosensitive gluconokinase [Yersinia kristensenii]CNF10980.1 putative thermosensitive gluconokinase [Yersinia kristensenii]
MSGKCIIVMGVSGTGKSCVGQALALALNAKFIDGDDLHPRANIQKMASGQPLNDSDRAPWLERLSDVAYSLQQKNEVGFLVCSALKKQYRDRLREGNQSIRFLWLTGDYDLVLSRMQQRAGHFMPESLLKSQFATLETPDAREPDIIPIDISPDIAGVVEHCIAALEQETTSAENNINHCA